VWGKGDLTRDYLNVADFVALCMRVLEAPMPEGTRIYNASSGRGVTINQLLGTIEHVTGQQIARVYQTQRTVDVSRIVLDNQLACNTFEWHPSVPLDQGLKEAWTWFQAQEMSQAIWPYVFVFDHQ
jgi:UDP-glucose 4-epimerase